MSDRRISIFTLLKNEGKLEKILVYPAVTIENDPTEHTKTTSFMNPVAIDGLVQQISFESLRWKYFGQIPQDSVQLICELRHENLLKLAGKITINNNLYKCYFDDNGFRIIRRTDYLICILERKINA